MKMIVTTQDRWAQLWDKLHHELAPANLFEQVVAAYSEPQRAYHTLAHIEQCLIELEQLPADLPIANPAAVEAAIWFHDVVYDPQAKDNEERSADFAVEVLQQHGVSMATVAEVRRLILATRHDRPETGDAALLVDIDLATLGKPTAQFEGYNLAIRQEYQWVPEPFYAAARIEILQRFLNRNTIYFTEWFQQQYESQARQNLQDEIDRLSQPIQPSTQ